MSKKKALLYCTLGNEQKLAKELRKLQQVHEIYAEEGYDLLQYACLKNQPGVVQMLVKKFGFSPKKLSHNAFQHTALHCAALVDADECVAALLEMVDCNQVNGKGHTAIQVAAACKSRKVLWRLLAHTKATVDEPLAQIAAEQGDHVLFRLFETKEANQIWEERNNVAPSIPMTRDQLLFCLAIRAGNQESILDFLRQGISLNLIHILECCLFQGALLLNILVQRLPHSFDWNQPLYEKNGTRLLHILSNFPRKLDVIGILLKRGADPSIANAHGMTALHTAAMLKRNEVLFEFLATYDREKPLRTEYFSLVDMEDMTFLHILMCFGDFEIRGTRQLIQILLQHVPANVLSLQDIRGNTIAHYAALRNQVQILEFLMQKNTNLLLQNKEDKTVAQCCAKDSECSKLFNKVYSSYIISTCST